MHHWVLVAHSKSVKRFVDRLFVMRVIFVAVMKLVLELAMMMKVMMKLDISGEVKDTVCASCVCFENVLLAYGPNDQTLCIHI